MAEKNNGSGAVEKGDTEKIIERLIPSSVGEDEIYLEPNNDKQLDPSIDRIFEENRKSLHKALQDEVQKALSQPVMPKPVLHGMRTEEPSESALSEEIAQQKTVEEIWEKPTSTTTNRKLVIVICVFITLIVREGGWALWQSINDERGNGKNLTILENEFKEKEQEQRTLDEEVSFVRGMIDRYFSATTVSQKSEYIYHAESFKTDIEAYYENNGGVKPVLDYDIKSIFPISLNGENVWEVLFKNKQSLKKEVRRCYVRKNSAGKYKVDWKSDVVFQEDTVQNFKETRSRKATNIKFLVDPTYDEMPTNLWAYKRTEYKVMRLSIPASDMVFWGLDPIYKIGTYNWGFKDTEYKVMRLEIPNSDMVFWGYVKVGSQQLRKLNRYINSDLKKRPKNYSMRHEFILKVRFLADSPHENDQYVLIDDVVSRNWINMDE